MNNSCTQKIVLAAALIAASPVVAAEVAPVGSANNVELVHGAITDGSGWLGVYDILLKDGDHVSVVQQPLTGLGQDVAATKRVIEVAARSIR